MLIDSIAYELNRKLGFDKFVVFLGYSPESEETTSEIAEGRDIATLRIEGGSIKPLKGNKGFSADCSLTLFGLLADGKEKESLDSINTAIDNLISETNGQLCVKPNSTSTTTSGITYVTENDVVYPEGGEAAAEDVMFNYFLSFGLPREVGEMEHLNGNDYIIKAISINITLTENLIFGNSGHLYLKLDDENYTELPEIVNWSYGVNTSTDQTTPLNTEDTKNIPLSSSLLMTAQLFLSTDSSWLSVLNTLKTNKGKIYTAKFQVDLGGSSYSDEDLRVIISSLSMTGVRGNFVVVNIGLSKAFEV